MKQAINPNIRDFPAPVASCMRVALCWEFTMKNIQIIYSTLGFTFIESPICEISAAKFLTSSIVYWVAFVYWNSLKMVYNCSWFYCSFNYYRSCTNKASSSRAFYLVISYNWISSSLIFECWSTSWVSYFILSFFSKSSASLYDYSNKLAFSSSRVVPSACL